MASSLFSNPMHSPLLLFLTQVGKADPLQQASTRLPPAPHRSPHAGIGHGLLVFVLVACLQLALTLFLTRVLGKFFSYFKQPHVIGEIVAGILMGPSVMGRIPGEHVHQSHGSPVGSGQQCITFRVLLQLAGTLNLPMAALKADTGAGC
jgi:hypothetical protein